MKLLWVLTWVLGTVLWTGRFFYFCISCLFHSFILCHRLYVRHVFGLVLGKKHSNLMELQSFPNWVYSVGQLILDNVLVSIFFLWIVMHTKTLIMNISSGTVCMDFQVLETVWIYVRKRIENLYCRYISNKIHSSIKYTSCFFDIV